MEQFENTAIIGKLSVREDSIGIDSIGDPDTRIITASNLYAKDVFNSGRAEAITPGDAFMVSVDGNPRATMFIVSRVLEYAADVESGYIATLRIAGNAYYNNPKLGSIPELPITTGRVLAYNTVIAVQFNAVPCMEDVIRSKFGHIVQNGVTYKMTNLLKRVVGTTVGTERLAVPAGYCGIYSSKDVPVNEDVTTMMKIISNETF